MSNIQYNVFGQQTYRLYGNGAESFYTYSPQRRWLTNKRTRIPSGTHIQDLNYVYDNVGNITRIRQYAGTWSSLGGSYTNDYIYDHQYRLISATETSSPNLFLGFSASYSPAGRLGHDFCSSNNVNKQLTYGYDKSGDTHQPRVIYDGTPELPYELYWDANGNLAQVVQCKQEQARFHLWDDNNRLSAVIGPNKVGFYGYDGNGVRVWKLTGLCQIDNQNGGEMSYSALLDDAVLYPNPYLTITPAGYTKHYYIGSERIATAIGEGGWGNALVNKDQHDAEISTAFFKRYENDLPCEQYQQTINYDIAGEYREEIQYNCKPKCLRYLKLNYAYDYLAKCINTYSKTLNQEKTFFTHSDHLGSASWITYSGGYPVQYIHYAPYGELMANQKTSSFDERYKFTGKERDAESGYDNFGARFYCSPFGIWTRPDPMLDKTIYLSSYMYCSGNPINNVDPNGMLDGKMLVRGTATIAFGVASTISGAYIIGGTLGGASPIGLLLVFDGYSSIGLGTSMFIYGLLSDPGQKNEQFLNTMPTSATNTLAKSTDIIFGNDNHAIEYSVDGLMIIVGGSIKGLDGTKKIYTNLATLAQGLGYLQKVYNEFREDITIDDIESVQTNQVPVDNTRVCYPEQLKPIPYETQQPIITQKIE